ncbi:MAG: hypothetical protein JWR09_2788 [Mucilaginibacter sp.]|nr:hypothetical protein [Mucilaginibacter sp.]
MLCVSHMSVIELVDRNAKLKREARISTKSNDIKGGNRMGFRKVTPGYLSKKYKLLLLTKRFFPVIHPCGNINIGIV